MKKNYKELYKQTLKEYQEFYKTLDAKTLKPASGLLRDYQLKTLDFCKKVLKQLEELNIPYFPIGGTLIGAIRHGGFVPWDDDFDIGMMREDYETFLVFCKENYICIPSETISFSQDNRTKVWNEYLKKYPNKFIYSRTPHHTQIIFGNDISDCVNIDIFPHDYYSPDCETEQYKEYIDEIKNKKQILDNYKSILDFFETEQKTNTIFDKNSNRIYYGLDNIDNYILSFKGFFTSDIIFPLKKIKFEDTEIYIQNKESDYAELQYSNFMSMPSDIEISPHINLRLENDINFDNKIKAVKSVLADLIWYIFNINVNDKNRFVKNMAADDLKHIIIHKLFPTNYKDLYEIEQRKLNFIKSIKG